MLHRMLHRMLHCMLHCMLSRDCHIDLQKCITATHVRCNVKDPQVVQASFCWIKPAKNKQAATRKRHHGGKVARAGAGGTWGKPMDGGPLPRVLK